MSLADLLSPLLGGALIGTSAAVLLLFHGRVAGISGILGGLLSPTGRADAAWRLLFLAGLVGAGLLMSLLMPEAFVNPLDRSPGAIILAGLLVGFGTRLGSGCTSGHGVCGLARLSVRSLAATLTFMLVGMLTATGIGALLGGAL